MQPQLCSSISLEVKLKERRLIGGGYYRVIRGSWLSCGGCRVGLGGSRVGLDTPCRAYKAVVRVQRQLERFLRQLGVI